jgi:polyisoprenoid-binding protein YceI
MKNTLIILALIASLSVNLKAQTFKANTETSTFGWIGYAAAGTYKATGTLKVSEGNLTLEKSKITKANIVFDMKTISHENKDLEEHLKNEDFFDVVKFPKAVFVLEKIVDNQAVGTLKIKDVQQKIAFPVVIKKSAKTMEIQANMSINRTDFGIKYNSTSFFSNLGDYAIKDTFDFKFTIFFKEI